MPYFTCLGVFRTPYFTYFCIFRCLLRRNSMAYCIGVWITLDSKFHMQKVPIMVPKVSKKATFGTTIGTFYVFSIVFSSILHYLCKRRRTIQCIRVLVPFTLQGFYRRIVELLAKKKVDMTREDVMKALHLTFVTAAGIKKNAQEGMIQSEVELDDLFGEKV